MKIDRLIVLHLYKHKQVTLQGIGSFHIDPSAVVPLDIDNTATLAADAVSFDYNAKAPEDASLINTIVQYTQKLKPLASADLDSFLHWQKQLLNINMPFTLLNVGMLQKTLQGQLIFVPFQPSAANSKAMRTSAPNMKHISPANHKYQNIALKYGKKITWGVIVLLGLGLFTWVFFYYEANNTYEEQLLQKQSAGMTSDIGTDTLKKNSVKPAQRIHTNYSPAEKTDVFKVIFLDTKIEIDAIKKLNEIYGFGHSGIMYLKDSSYKIAIPFSRPLSDTSLIKDSLNRYYSLGEGHVEIE